MIEYHGQSPLDNIKKDQPDGWLLAEIERQSNDKYVLTRFIPASQDKGNQIFYAVFEEEAKNSDLSAELAEAINKHHPNIDQQESKNAANK